MFQLCLFGFIEIKIQSILFKKKEKHLSLIMVKFALQTHLIIFALCQQDFCDTKWLIPIFKTGFIAY